MSYCWFRTSHKRKREENVSINPFPASAGRSPWKGEDFIWLCCVVMFHLVEPTRWVNLLKWLFAWMQASVFRSYRIPVFADLFVFTYPVYLLALYLYGMLKKKIYYKVSGLVIGFWTAISFLSNIFIQFFVDKVRPNVVLGLPDLKNETILHGFMPSSSFPSDHAALTMSIAMMSLFRGIHNKDRKFLRFGGILIIFSLITWFARVTSGVHRPTDIIWGSVVGIVVPFVIIMRKPVYRFIHTISERIAKAI